jgi:GAF domain-containing protein
MANKIEHWLRLDQAQSADERRQRITLYSIGIPLMVVVLAAFIALTAAGWQSTRNMVGIGIFICLGLLILAWSGQLRWASILYPTAMLLILTAIAFLGDGLYDEAVIAFTALIAMSGLLLRRTGVIVFTLLSIVATTFLGVAHHLLWIQKYADVFSITRVIIIDILLALGGVFIYFVINNLVSNIASLRQNELSLAASNQELQGIRASLENQVIERTARVEAARQEAEVARRTLETQMWQVSGQAKLSETLRGEQTIETLSLNIVSFLCCYLELPAGALFVRQGNILQFQGGYAYMPDDPATTRFAIGEGLVGQVALEKQTLIFDSLLAKQLIIPSALGNIVPQALLLLPLVYNSEVVGVLELGALQPFAQEQINFLEQSAESMAIAFHTTQTRMRFAELLEETQRQAEELQAQEEELRAANEELLAHIESTRQSRE